MRRFAPLALIALAIAAPVRGDDLFSEIAVESVFDGSTKAEATGSTAAAPAKRVTGAGQLSELLREAGMEPERVDAKTVEVKVAHGQWTIPTTLFAAVDRGEVDITMGLATPEKGAKWDANKLLRLLADPETGGVYFAFDSSKGQVQVRKSLSAREVSATRLSRLLTEMAEFAVARETAWYEESSDLKAKTAEGKGAAPTSLVGSWIASLGEGEAFAIKLTADGKFNLAHVKAGKTTTSAGKMERTGDQLKLIGDKGVTIAGAVANASAEGFDLTLTGGKVLSFKKAAK
ncbi:hypothetical protein Pla108_23280 [Botrimarina colliarenosi]|uniref:Uncharacterized protein n=1 Tax=Botrimarina colliarenosi TaxID=2528001 RepID=A0A5C6AGI1_9BACT|nr:hypothetical protein [Botrimarina colliarenosi]TWT98171.1 hypothetical protein Pla108_23280 [Botrimarina colliarenosi]